MQPGSMSGRRVLITGGTQGLGLEAAVQLQRLGAVVAITGRDDGKLAAAAAEIARRSGSPPPRTWRADFAVLADVRALAAALLAEPDPIHVLLNNAGTVFDARSTTVDGFESTFAVNHLAPFLLTRLLEERLLASAPARVVTVSSAAHFRATMDFDDLHYAKGGWSTMASYGRSKLANVFMTRSLGRRWDPTRVTATCLHPGGVATNIWSHAPWFVRPLLTTASRWFMYTAEQGAAPVVRLCADPDVAGRTGLYYDRELERWPSRFAQDDAVADRLWAESERMVGL